MNTLKYKDFIGSVAFSEADNVFFGKIEGIDGLVNFEAVDDYLAYCAEEGISIGTAPQSTPNTRAENVLKLFNEHGISSFIDLKNEILNSFREKIGTLAV